jgi:hypothetical protein
MADEPTPPPADEDLGERERQREDYERHKARVVERQAKMSPHGRDLGQLPPPWWVPTTPLSGPDCPDGDLVVE